jgi:hypothetical protein
MRKHRKQLLRAAGNGAAAGAVGTIMLDSITYLDIATTGRPASTTPQDTITRASRITHIPIPGDGSAQDNRVFGIGSLMGYALGVGTGALLGAAAQLTGRRPMLLSGALAASGVAMVVANGPMIALGTTNVRTWSASDWLRDILPHLGYGLGAAWTFRRLRS